MTKLSSEKAIFSTKITQAWRVITHAERGLGGTVAHPNIYICFKFQRLAQKWQSFCQIMLFFSTKISQPWPMVTHAYRPFNGLNFRMISTHISSFIKIGREMTKLSPDKAIYGLKSVRRDPWSPMHISLLMDSSLGWYLPTFQVSSKWAEKWRSYRRRKLFFQLKSVRHDPWSPMHIDLLMDSTLDLYLVTFQDS